MDVKTLEVLEFPKILERLAQHTAFAAGRERALALKPASSLRKARSLQAETTEARALLASHPGIGLRGVRDIRPHVEAARRGITLAPEALLEIKATLARSRDLRRDLLRLQTEAPRLADIAALLPPPIGLIDAIARTLTDEGEIPDSASPTLARLRADMTLARQRLTRRLERMVRDPAIVPMLQEPIVTQRGGRYVLPLKAEFKGRLKGIVHDRSASGATLFVEPLPIVEINNHLRELERAAEQEIRRLLAALSQEVAIHADTLLQAVETLARLDVIFGKAALAEQMEATAPRLVPFRPRPLASPSGRGKGESPQQGEGQGGKVRATPETTAPTHPGVTLRLLGARHPLLPLETAVPIDLVLDEDIFALVITGPNTGGKTVTLKTAGLLALMAQAGFHIPAEEGSALSVFANIFADIGDEQSIEQSLSTFSGHMRNIVRILKRADSRDLVLLDELGAGTDPQEGAALARAILDHLVRRGVTTLVATHYPELKLYAHATPGVANASMAFDAHTLRPTYRLVVGLPGRSNALEIAQRLGLSEEIIAAARAGFHPDDLKADALLDEIHRQRRLARKERRRAEKARRRAEALRAKLARRLAEIDKERRQVLAEAQSQAQAEVEALREEIRTLRRRLRRLLPPAEALEAQNELRTAQQAAEALETEVEERLTALEAETAPPEPPPVAGPPPPLAVGAKVHVERLNAQGTVSALDEEAGEAEVVIGALRVRTPIRDLRVLAPPPPQGAAVGESSVRVPEVASPGMALDLRGLTADEALERLDKYLDQAYLAGLPFVRIVHGKGTGRLRAAVRDALERHPHVRAWESGLPQEGGDGVTIAKLAGE
ncbi:MAG TPA: endonuclease MutS2 [Chloroflexi bacterium]|nr:endonuclease MutS2 [Chloroflexota bacterium]